jgi:hypothetical protein
MFSKEGSRMSNIATEPKRQFATRWIYNDGGRAAAGFNGTTGDCACRAIAIATGKPYREVYAELNALCALLGPRRASAETGLPDRIAHIYLGQLGWRWTSTDKARLHRWDLPPGRIIAAVSKHLVALVDNVVHDDGEHWRGRRPVYGYYTLN